MPSVLERHRNNVKAGIFVSIALILGLAVIIVLTDAIDQLRRRTNAYVVVFDVASGVPNIKRGSEVRVGGMTLGRVTSITPRLAGDHGGALRQIAVDFELDRIAQLYEDAIVFVSGPLIGSEGWLDIPSVGTPERGEVRGEIVGQDSAGFLTALLGSENTARAEQIVANSLAFSEFLARVPGEYDQRFIPIVDDVKATTGDLRTVSESLRQTHWPSWAAAVDQVMEWAANVPPRIDSALAEGEGLFSDARGVVSENREGVRAIVNNVEQTTATINNETIDKVHRLLDTGQQGLDSAAATLRELQNDYDVWATDVGESLANATIASQQLKLATIEVRRSPWKLLYRPTTDEVQHENLYEAARSFAVAAADLKAAAASVQRIIDTNAAETLRESESFQRVQRSLMESLDRYEKAQQQLLDIIIASPAN